jgi:hypothetical protein
MVAAALLGALVAWHPIHSSLTTVELRRGDSIARLTIKVYAEDFPPGQDPARIQSYLAGRIGFVGSGGPTVVSQRVDGPVQWIIATISVRSDGTPRLMRNTLLMDRFRDQVNVVQAHCGSTGTTVLFAGSPEPKRLETPGC